MPAAIALAVAFVVGSVPIAYVVARATSGEDLRRVGTGTVGGTAVYAAAGFGPVAVAGVLDIAKGVLAVAGAGSRPVVGAFAAGLAITGHNWSPFLRGGGGRGLAPALGATGWLAWEGALVLALGLAGGRLARHTGLGVFIAQVALIPTLAVTRGSAGALLACLVVGPMWLKRALANRPAAGGRAYLHRLLFDADPGAEPFRREP